MKNKQIDAEYLDVDLDDGSLDFDDVIVDEKTKRKNRRGEESDDYVDNQNLYTLICEWQEKANDFAVKYQHQIAPYFPDKKDGNSYEKAISEAIKNKAVPQEPKIPDAIGLSIMRISEKYSMRPNFNGYTWREEMVDDAILDGVRGVRKFNSVQYKNPFAYFTQISHWAFTGRIGKEKSEHARKMEMAFDPTNEKTYTTLEGDTTVYDIGFDDLADFYYNGGSGAQ